MALHSIFGSSAPGGSWHQFGRIAGKTVWMGSPFRLTSGYATLSVPTATCVGGRFYLPPSASISGAIPTYAIFRCWEHSSLTKSVGYVNSVTYSLNQLAAYPVREVRLDNLVFGGWNEAFFDPPIRMPIVGRMLAIAVGFPDSPGFYGYWDNSHVSPDVDHMASDGYPLAWPPNDLAAPETYAHGWRCAGDPPTQDLDTFTLAFEVGGPNLLAGYGIDILVADDNDDGKQELYVAGAGDLRLVNIVGAEGASGVVAAKAVGWWDGSALQPLRKTDPDLAGLSATTQYVRITCTGATFNPMLTFRDHEGTVRVRWTVEEDSANNVTNVNPAAGTYTPTINRPASVGSGSWHVQLFVDDNAGHSRMNIVETFNIGYDDSVDTAERSSLGTDFNKSAEAVSYIEHINSLTGLLHFMADHTQIGTHPLDGLPASIALGVMDFSGMKLLRFLSAYTTNITGVTLTGCTSLRRLVIEECYIDTIDLNPVRDCLEDIRAAFQITGNIKFTTLTGPMSKLWHYCVRDQTITNSLNKDNFTGALPVASQIWDWNTPKPGPVARSGTYSPESPYANWLVSHHNGWTALNLNGQQHLDILDFSNNALASISVTGTVAPTGTINLSSNALPAAEVNKVLAWLVAGGRTGQTLLINGGTNAAPTGAGVTDKATLISRGWTCTTT